LKEADNANTSLLCVDTARLRQWLYLFGNEGVVYAEAQNRFAGLDAAGVSAYQAFDAGAVIEDLTPSSDAPAARQALEAIHALSQGIFPPENPPPDNHLPDLPSIDRPSPDRPFIDWPSPGHSGSANIEIHGIPVLVEYPTGPWEDICRDYFRNCPPATQPAQCRLHAQHTENGWTIYVNGRELIALLREEQLGLGLLHAARSLLYAQGEYDIAFHAATVAEGDCGVMLCAPRESGKSTLAAYLVSQGFELLTDEPALLHLGTCSVSPLPLPISLKQGSWPVLRNEWPQLASAPTHVRSDGTKIRLLHPPKDHLATKPRRLTHIIFPEYRPSSAANAERLSPLSALRLLNEGGMVLAPRLARDNFEAFLRLISLTPAYAIRYASLGEAHRIIRNLTIEGTPSSALRSGE
jgi:hypothetical protein